MDRIEDSDRDEYEGPVEIALVGDLTDNEAELTDRLLSVPPRGECVLFIDSPGGSPYCAIALTTLIKLRGLRATGIVTGECSSATLWPLAACERRIVTPYSVMLFHPMKWQSEEHVGLQEAAEWARHFGTLEKDMDRLLAELLGVDNDMLDKWINPGRYVSGREFAEAGLAELVTISSMGANFLSGDNGSAARHPGNGSVRKGAPTEKVHS
ncbi:MAG: ATP-dependent Clp protease proteolytic subunit [Pirellulaceae bacterium]